MLSSPELRYALLRRSENFKTLNFIPFRAGNTVYMSNESEKDNFQCIGLHLGMPI